MADKLGRMVTYLQWFSPTKWSFGHVVLLDHVTSKPLYLHYYSDYDHQTWQVSDLTLGALFDIVTWSFNHVVLLDEVMK